MNKEDKLVLGTLAGVDLILSPEHYEEYKGTLNKQLEEANQEIDRLNNIINELEKWLYIEKNQYYEFYYKVALEDVLDKLKELKEGNKDENN